MKVGIITLYHNSINYGGNLQAYALCKYLEKIGVEAEQIAYEYDRKMVDNHSLFVRIERFLNQGFFMAIKKVLSVIKSKLNTKQVEEHALQIRKRAFNTFLNEIIPHSKKVYNQYSIRECVDIYDIFITGSDQVWNFSWYDTVYFLDFVNGNEKKKLSYAASFSMKVLNNVQRRIVEKSLNDYTAISVRENEGAQLLSGLTEKKVSYVVDPTFLLDKDDWEDVCSGRIIQNEYILGYFIGSNADAVKKAKEFANKKGLEFVMIPFASGRYNMPEEIQKNSRMYDIGPERFLSLIKYAEYIFTDSFHAVVFSTIFQKQFYVFNRDSNGSMNSRITNLTDMFDLQERFCATKEQETLEYIERLKEIDYDRVFPKFEECREKSYEFIRKNILET